MAMEASMAMEAGAAPSLCSPHQGSDPSPPLLSLFPQGTEPPPPLHPSDPPVNSSYPAASIPCVEQPVSDEVFEEKGTSRVQKKEKDGSHIREKKIRKKPDGKKLRQVVKGNSRDTVVQESGEACEEPQRSRDVHGGKRSLSRASESSRAAKVARTIDSKVVMTQLKTKMKGRKLPPIISGSPMLNLIARKKAQTSGRSPNQLVRSPSTNWHYCNNIFPASKVSGTSQLARHLKVCEVKCSMDGLVQQMKNSDEIDPDWKFDQEIARSELVKLVVLHGLPFSFVEYVGFRKFCAVVNPWFKPISRVTIQNDCIEAYHQYRSYNETFFKNCNHRVSLTGDMWTSNQKLGYLCITCHWIDKNWKVKHRIIRFCLVETPHDAWNIFGVVLQSIRDWNIESKICSFTLDNAEVNTKMIGHLRTNLVDRKLIHHKGKLLHIRCAAHVLNLIVQDGLKSMDSVVDNIRNSVKYIRSSQHRIEQFDKMVLQNGIECKHQPSLDVSTRWNSTFLMLESTLPFRKVFETLQQQEPSYTFGPSNQEWQMVVDICRLLKVFCHATNIISGSNYPTSNLYFLEIWSVKVVLDEQEKSSNATIRIMVREMKKKFHKYFMESYLTNCIPVVLDPRFKMELVEFRLKKYFGVGADKHILEVKEAIAALFLAYAAEVEDFNSMSQEQSGEETGLADDALSDFDEHIKLKKANSCNELQRYLEEDFHPRTPDFDILKWWAVNSPRYPVLGNIARDVLAVPASTVASESAFSTCGRVITDHRTSLGAESVEALMCFGDWIRRGEPSCEESKPDEVS